MARPSAEAARATNTAAVLHPVHAVERADHDRRVDWRVVTVRQHRFVQFVSTPISVSLAAVEVADLRGGIFSRQFLDADIVDLLAVDKFDTMMPAPPGIAIIAPAPSGRRSRRPRDNCVELGRRAAASRYRDRRRKLAASSRRWSVTPSRPDIASSGVLPHIVHAGADASENGADAGHGVLHGADRIGDQRPAVLERTKAGFASALPKDSESLTFSSAPARRAR